MSGWDGEAFDRWLTTEPGGDEDLALALTREELADLISKCGQSGHLIAREARKPHRCVCADAQLPNGGMEPRRNPEYRPECLAEITLGDVYAEDTGNAAAHESGQPYCARCALAVWLGGESEPPALILCCGQWLPYPEPGAAVVCPECKSTLAVPAEAQETEGSA